MEYVGKSVVAVFEKKEPAQIGEIVCVDYTPLGSFANIKWFSGHVESVHLPNIKSNKNSYSEAGIYLI